MFRVGVWPPEWCSVCALREFVSACGRRLPVTWRPFPARHRLQRLVTGVVRTTLVAVVEARRRRKNAKAESRPVLETESRPAAARAPARRAASPGRRAAPVERVRVVTVELLWHCRASVTATDSVKTTKPCGTDGVREVPIRVSCVTCWHVSGKGTSRKGGSTSRSKGKSSSRKSKR